MVAVKVMGLVAGVVTYGSTEAGDPTTVIVGAKRATEVEFVPVDARAL
jgi:hypothetical protein